jgi:hypothetical protein
MLHEKDIEDFTVGIDDHGFLLWKVKLKNDNELYQIKYRIEPHITPAGNKSKRKIYFIRKNNKELIFDDKVKNWFRAFRMPYCRDGI